MMLHLKLDLQPMARAIREMGTETRDFVIWDALNRTVDGLKTEAVRGIVAQTNLKRGDVFPKIHKMVASRGSMSAGLRATSDWYHGKPGQLGTRASRRGVSFKPWLQTQRMPGAFIATMRSGHTSIFVRYGSHSKLRRAAGGGNRRTEPQWARRVFNAKTGRRNSQLPIVDVGWGPNPAVEMIRQDAPTGQALQRIAQERFTKRFAQNYDRMVSRVKAKHGL